MKLKSFRMAAVVAVLFGMMSCGSKVNTAELSDSPSVDTAAEILDSNVALDSALTQMADSVTADAKPGPDGYITTPSGLKYKVIKKGSGRTPTAADVVNVDYEGKLVDGTVFDSSYQRGESIEFPLNRVIAGWTEGLQLMQEGAEYEFYIPYQLAYGEQGSGPIPPKSDLIFKVELHQVK